MKGWKTRLAPRIRYDHLTFCLLMDVLGLQFDTGTNIWRKNTDHQNFIARIFLIVRRESSHMGWGETIKEMHWKALRNKTTFLRS